MCNVGHVLQGDLAWEVETQHNYQTDGRKSPCATSIRNIASFSAGNRVGRLPDVMSFNRGYVKHSLVVMGYPGRAKLHKQTKDKRSAGEDDVVEGKENASSRDGGKNGKRKGKDEQ
jgi:hypothetical protein